MNWPNNYFTSNETTTSWISIADADTISGTSYHIEQKKEISPKLYFTYVKKKFGLLGGRRLEGRMKRLEKLVEQSLKDGQIALGEQYFNIITREIRESEMYAAGFKIFIEREHLEKFQNITRGRSISIDPMKNFVRVIPKDVLARKAEAERLKLFDGYVVVHYDPKGKARKQTEAEERRDPILFGIIRESNRYYFIGDWEDEFCDLTLDDIVDKIKLEDEEITISKNPSLK